MNDKEKILWLILKDKNYSNLKFKRQYQIDKYVLDFYCEELNLGLEFVDSENIQSSYHLLRKKYFRANGIEIITLPENYFQKQVKQLLNKILYKKRKQK